MGRERSQGWRGETISLGDAEEVFHEIVSRARTQLLALPGKLAPVIHDSCETELEIEHCLRQAIEEVLLDLSREGDTAINDYLSWPEDREDP